MAERNIVRAAVTHEDLSRLCSFPGEFPPRLELPADAKLVGYYKDDERYCFWAIFRHESFDFVPIGEKVPVWPRATKIDTIDP